MSVGVSLYLQINFYSTVRKLLRAYTHVDFPTVCRCLSRILFGIYLHALGTAWVAVSQRVHSYKGVGRRTCRQWDTTKHENIPIKKRLGNDYQTSQLLLLDQNTDFTLNSANTAAGTKPQKQRLRVMRDGLGQMSVTDKISFWPSGVLVVRI